MTLKDVRDHLLQLAAKTGQPISSKEAMEAAKWFKINQFNPGAGYNDPVADEATDRILFDQTVEQTLNRPQGIKKTPFASQILAGPAMQKTSQQSLKKE